MGRVATYQVILSERLADVRWWMPPLESLHGGQSSGMLPQPNHVRRSRFVSMLCSVPTRYLPMDYLPR